MITKIMEKGDYSPSLNRLENLLQQFADSEITLDEVWGLMYFYYTTEPTKTSISITSDQHTIN